MPTVRIPNDSSAAFTIQSLIFSHWRSVVSVGVSVMLFNFSESLFAYRYFVLSFWKASTLNFDIMRGVSFFVSCTETRNLAITVLWSLPMSGVLYALTSRICDG
jgi:hypothetical protein